MLERKPLPDVDALAAAGVLFRAGAQSPPPLVVGDTVRIWSRAAWRGVVTDVLWTWCVEARYRPGAGYGLERTLEWYWEAEVRLTHSRRGIPIRKRWARYPASSFVRLTSTRGSGTMGA